MDTKTKPRITASNVANPLDLKANLIPPQPASAPPATVSKPEHLECKVFNQTLSVIVRTDSTLSDIYKYSLLKPNAPPEKQPRPTLGVMSQGFIAGNTIYILTKKKLLAMTNQYKNPQTCTQPSDEGCLLEDPLNNNYFFIFSPIKHTVRHLLDDTVVFSVNNVHLFAVGARYFLYVYEDQQKVLRMVPRDFLTSVTAESFEFSKKIIQIAIDEEQKDIFVLFTDNTAVIKNYGGKKELQLKDVSKISTVGAPVIIFFGHSIMYRRTTYSTSDKPEYVYVSGDTAYCVPSDITQPLEVLKLETTNTEEEIQLSPKLKETLEECKEKLDAALEKCLSKREQTNPHDMAQELLHKKLQEQSSVTELAKESLCEGTDDFLAITKTMEKMQKVSLVKELLQSGKTLCRDSIFNILWMLSYEKKFTIDEVMLMKSLLLMLDVDLDKISVFEADIISTMTKYGISLYKTLTDDCIKREVGTFLHICASFHSLTNN